MLDKEVRSFQLVSMVTWFEVWETTTTLEWRFIVRFEQYLKFFSFGNSKAISRQLGVVKGRSATIGHPSVCIYLPIPMVWFGSMEEPPTEVKMEDADIEVNPYAQFIYFTCSMRL